MHFRIFWRDTRTTFGYYFDRSNVHFHQTSRILRCSAGDPIAVDIDACICAQMSGRPAFSCTLDKSKARSFGSSRSVTGGIALSPWLLKSDFNSASLRSTIATRAPAAGVASARPSDPRRRPCYDGTLASNSLAVELSLCWGHHPLFRA